MANATAARPCRFRWEIFNPFLPWRNLEAAFSHGSPTVTQWKVILQPMCRRVNYWKFMVSLEFDEWFDHRDEVVADYLLVLIYLNSTIITRKEFPSYCFSKENKYTYCFQEQTRFRPRMDPHHFVIEIQISLSSNATENEVGNGLISSEEDVRWLSRDLGKLLRDTQYSNMNLMSWNNPLPIIVHSYIIDVRWDNFFKLHAYESDRDRVETNISCGLLFDILTYMYSGTLGMTWPDWTNAAYITELFEVIYRYKLYHIYKIFVKNELQQMRVTRNPGFIESCLFPLEGINGRLINNSSYTWYVNPNPEYEFTFQIRVNANLDGPWLSYSLQSNSSTRVYATVYLEIIKMVPGPAFRTTWPLHERDYTIDLNATVESRRVLFRACPEEFGDFTSISSDGTEIQYFIRCLLNVTTGLTVNQVRSMDDDHTLQNDLESINVLSDHMHRLNQKKVEADMSIVSSSGDPDVKDEDEHCDGMHKAIFTIRMPNCWEGLQNVHLGRELPELVTSTLSRAALPIVIDYMYTGKVFPIPQPLLHKIEHFAQRTLFYPLFDLISRISSGVTNQ